MKNVLFVLLLFLCGCRTEYVPLEVVRYDSIVFVSLDRDSVYLKEKGDTVEKFQSKYVYVYKDRVDTFYMEKIREVEVPVPVERKLSWWERVKLEYTEWMLAVLVAVALIYALRQWLARKVRKE